MADEKIINTGKELNQRIRESGQSVVPRPGGGWYLNQTHERVSDKAVSERRAGMDRLRDDLRREYPSLSRSL
jgi:hypothetical protein